MTKSEYEKVSELKEAFSNMPNKDFLKAQKNIDKLSKQLTLYITKTDQKIQENFWNLKKEFEKYKENCENGN